jgi:hypothetical protein
LYGLREAQTQDAGKKQLKADPISGAKAKTGNRQSEPAAKSN